MSSAVQNSAARSAPRVPQTSLDVDAAMIDTLRALAPSIDPLVTRFNEGTRSTHVLDASRQFMDIQQAVAEARIALEKRFPELKGRGKYGATEKTDSPPRHVRDWARKVHYNLSALETRIREGYRSRENPVDVRDAIIVGGSEYAPSALRVLGVIIESKEVSNFDVSDPRNARALGIRSNLSLLPLFKKVA